MTAKFPRPGSLTSDRKYATFTDIRGRGCVSRSWFWIPPSWCHIHFLGVGPLKRWVHVQMAMVHEHVHSNLRGRRRAEGSARGRAVRGRADRVRRSASRCNGSAPSTAGTFRCSAHTVSTASIRRETYAESRRVIDHQVAVAFEQPPLFVGQTDPPSFSERQCVPSPIDGTVPTRTTDRHRGRKGSHAVVAGALRYSKWLPSGTMNVPPQTKPNRSIVRTRRGS